MAVKKMWANWLGMIHRKEEGSHNEPVAVIPWGEWERRDKEMRKMLNAAWDRGKMAEWYVNTPRSIYPKRWRDVSRIIKEAKKKEKQDG